MSFTIPEEILLPCQIKREEGSVDPLVEDFCELIEPLKHDKFSQGRSINLHHFQHETGNRNRRMKDDVDFSVVLTRKSLLHNPLSHKALEQRINKQDILESFTMPTIMVCALCDRFECLDRRILVLHVYSKHKDIVDNLCHPQEQGKNILKSSLV